MVSGLVSPVIQRVSLSETPNYAARTTRYAMRTEIQWQLAVTGIPIMQEATVVGMEYDEDMDDTVLMEIMRVLMQKTVESIEKRQPIVEEKALENAKLSEFYIKEQVRKVSIDIETQRELERIRESVQPVLSTPYPKDSTTAVVPRYYLSGGTGDSTIDASRYVSWAGTRTGSSSGV